MAVNYKKCVAGYNERREECTDWRDDGYETCNRWEKKCVVSWIPIIGPLICKVFKWFCMAAVWVSHWVCHAVNVIITFVCTAWETLIPILSIALGWLIEVILAIPIVGSFIRQILAAATWLGAGLVGLVVEGGLCGLFGICLTKRLRLCVIIEHDGRAPVATPQAIAPIIQRTKEIFKSELNIDVQESYHDGQAPNVSPVKCDSGAWIEDLLLKGSQYQMRRCRWENFATVIGVGSPIYAFFVRDIIDKVGCSLGPLSSYVTVETTAGNTTLAHEIGHACGFPHNSDQNNIMYKDGSRGTTFTGLQKSIVRGSKYVTYY